MISGSAGQNHRIPISYCFGSQPPNFEKSDAGGIDVELVSSAFFHYFRISGNDADSSTLGSGTHGGQQLFQNSRFQPFFQNQRTGKEFRFSSAYGNIIYRTVYGKLSDISARKEQRIHHKTVG